MALPRRRTAGGLLLGVGSLAIPLALWWGVALHVRQQGGIPFPTPYDTARRLLDLVAANLLNDFTIYRHVGDSLLRWGAGFGIAMVVGILSGMLLGWSRLLERLSMPTVTVLQLVPGLAWIPVAILLFGIGAHDLHDRDYRVRPHRDQHHRRCEGRG
jgi:ABC-type nitrate/sulfonate/bicarbonate transport system permease component